jgi:hypothetical protein
MALFVEAVVLLLATAMAFTAGTRIAQPIGLSPWLMPLVVGSITAIVTAIVLVSEIRQRIRDKTSPQQTTSESPTVVRVAGWLLLTTVYAVATPIFGFEWSTVVFLLIALQIFGNANLWTTVGTAIAVAGVLPLVFRHVFHAIVP